MNMRFSGRGLWIFRIILAKGFSRALPCSSWISSPAVVGSKNGTAMSWIWTRGILVGYVAVCCG